MLSSQSESTAEPPVRLVVDIGNTTTTAAVFRGKAEPSVESMASNGYADTDRMADLFRRLSGRYGAPEAIALCSVVPGITAACTTLLGSMFPVPVLHISSALRLPFRLDYGDCRTFGADRLALCAWGRHLCEGRAVIAIDIGTAITFDVLGSDGAYRGGLIMPGIDMMAGSLHSRTAQLPLVEIGKPDKLLGRSTEECIRSGIYWGAVSQIGGLVDVVADELIRESGEPSVEVIVTGGNSRSIASEIGSVSVIDELAVLRGADLLLRMNLP
ncbi:MAG: type III pantothenate kinase [Chlorobiaceae bacterium]|nr:type III pantothenate kinase [Chlorobiaceae bacterium]